MKINGFNVNVPAIAEGLYRMVPDLPECYTHALGLGMLPQPLMESLERSLGEVYDNAVKTQLGCSVTEAVSMCLSIGVTLTPDTKRRASFINETVRLTSLEIYKLASRDGLLRV